MKKPSPNKLVAKYDSTHCGSDTDDELEQTTFNQHLITREQNTTKSNTNQCAHTHATDRATTQEKETKIATNTAALYERGAKMQ